MNATQCVPMKFSLEKTYAMAENPPPAMAWEVYRTHVQTAWDALLAKDPVESEVQEFLEQHPSMVPGAHGLLGKSGHSPIHMALISQPVLPSYRHKVPDFMWIATDSATIYPVLIEIEAPGKPWFTQAGRQHAKLTEAINQLIDWRVWLEDSINRQRFREYYDILPERFLPKAFKPLFVLIYGRRAEANSSPNATAKRDALQGEQQFFMTYDRLSPDHEQRDHLCARFLGSTPRPIALSVPPTLQLGPALCPRYLAIEGLAEAIGSNTLMTAARRNFLLSRLPYWERWVKGGNRGVTAGERE